MNNYKPIGVITLDADGQHSVTDANLVAKNLIDNPNCLVLGVRNFTNKIPLKSKIGNILTRIIFKITTGESLSDTQTGLRGIPHKNLEQLTKIKQNRYEYELEMLIQIKKNGQQYLEVPIETIYHNDNKGSHFNPILDSMRIYYILLRYISLSFIAVIIDFIVFAIAQYFLNNILKSLIISRSISAFIQFIIAKNFVFKSEVNKYISLIKFITLVIINIYLTKEIMNILITNLSYINTIQAKLISETCLFFTSFVIQNYLIFNKNKKVTIK